MVLADPPRTLVRVPELRQALKDLFGFDEFRPGQERVVRAALEGRDTLALMPTGAGKSLTYQLAAMLRPTPTLVLSPLIAIPGLRGGCPEQGGGVVGPAETQPIGPVGVAREQGRSADGWR